MIMPAMIIALPHTLRKVIGLPKKIRSNKRMYTYAEHSSTFTVIIGRWDRQ